MGKEKRSDRLRKKTSAEVMHSKQATFDSLPVRSSSEHESKLAKSDQIKQIVITELAPVVREDELVLKVGFKLLPSKVCFSKVWLELYFEGQKLNIASIAIPQSLLVKDDFELTPVLEMKGIPAGSYAIRVELFEKWASGEILTSAYKGIQLAYVPVNRQDRLIKVPTVKSVAGADLSVISDNEKSIYHNIVQDIKKEQASKRDHW